MVVVQAVAKSGKAPKQPSQSSKFQVRLMWETLSQKYKVGKSRGNHATLTSGLHPHTLTTLQTCACGKAQTHKDTLSTA